MLQDVIKKGHLRHLLTILVWICVMTKNLSNVSRAKKISNNAYRYLAGHSETWQQRSLVGIRPKKVLRQSE